MITSSRFALALSALDGSQWRLFERLATVFMSTEYPSMRPVADPSGDGGADGLLFVVEDDPTTLVQFSVRKDWKAKIKQTCTRLTTTYPDVSLVVFVTNQTLGSEATQVRRDVRREFGIYLDPRDGEWLIAQRNSTSANMAEAEELATQIVDPLLSSPEAISHQAQALDDLEAKAAFVYLGLQWADETREKGLTKLCFEAIIRSVLRDTASDNRLSRQAVRDSVAKLLPAQHRASLDAQVDGALNRLSKRFIRHWAKPDEFCLTWDERLRLSERITELNLMDTSLSRELSLALRTSLAERGIPAPDARKLDAMVDVARRVLERVLLERGEAFSEAVRKGVHGDLRYEDVEAVVDKVLLTTTFAGNPDPQVLASTVQGLLLAPPEDVRTYLRGLADTYTLFAFMRETPDVQSAIVKMFSDADIWLDTSVVLPLLAEELLEPHLRSHSDLFAATVEAGLRLYITEGVLEELTTHVRRSDVYARALHSREGGHGEPPFLYGAYKLSGQDISKFGSWLQNFCGGDPDADLLDYLEEEHRIKLEPLAPFADEASVELRSAVAEVWQESREARVRRNEKLGIQPMDVTTRNKLVSHDVENYVGVVMRRIKRGERRSAFGYKSWWLTLDGTAFRVHKRLETELNEAIPASPAISPDFMINYLAIGPVRSRLSKKSEESLPLMLNMRVMDAVPPDLLVLAEELRQDLADLPARVVRRKIRETLEDARKLLGPKAAAGEVGLTEEIKARLRAQARII